MVVYLPIAFLKDWLGELLRRCHSKSGRNAVCVNSPLKDIGVQQIFETEPSLSRKDCEVHLLPHGEGRALVAKSMDDSNLSKRKRQLTTRQIAARGFYVAPIWFVTELSSGSTLLHSERRVMHLVLMHG